MSEPMTEHDAQQAEAAGIVAWLKPESLTVIQTREEGDKITAMSKAAIAYYNEQNDYDNVMKAWRLYVEARRVTTGLCLEEWQGNTDVTLSAMGFTKMQWHRRMKEYKLSEEQVNAYFDDLISKGWQPSIAGLLKSSGETIEPDEETRRQQQIAAFRGLVAELARQKMLTKAQALQIVEESYKEVE